MGASRRFASSLLHLRGDRAGALPVRRRYTALRLSAWSIVMLAALGGVAMALLWYRGDAQGGARTANREIEFLLQHGESVDQRVPVMQRHWWDYLRLTHGVLAVTNRRLLYVGVPPEELLRREPEPPELDEKSWALGSALEARTRRVHLGTRPGVVLTLEGGHETFAVAPRDFSRLTTVLQLVRRRQEEHRLTQEAERRALEAATASARRAIYHLVRPGESLEVIAERYGTLVDSLRRWNALPGDRIQAGRRLLVKPER
jgi:hypothetical protein